MEEKETTIHKNQVAAILIKRETEVKTVYFAAMGIMGMSMFLAFINPLAAAFPLLVGVLGGVRLVNQIETNIKNLGEKWGINVRESEPAA